MKFSLFYGQSVPGRGREAAERQMLKSCKNRPTALDRGFGARLEEKARLVPEYPEMMLPKGGAVLPLYFDRRLQGPNPHVRRQSTQ